MYDLQSKKLVEEWEGCDNMVNALEWAPFADSQRPVLVYGGTDGYVSVTDVSGAGASSLSLQGLQDALLHLDGADGRVGGMHAVRGAGSGKAKCLLNLTCSSKINSVACSADGRVYVGDQGSAILEFDLRNPGLISGAAQRAAVSADTGVQDAR